MAKFLIKWFQVAILASSLVMTSSGWAEEAAATDSASAESTAAVEADSASAESDSAVETATERPGYLTIMGDIMFVRPITLVATAVGSVFFVVTLPITLLTGTVGEAGATMVADPALNTFVRCLGCKEVGWRKLPPQVLDDPMDKTM